MGDALLHIAYERCANELEIALLALPADRPPPLYVCGYCGTAKIDADGEITHYEGCSRPGAPAAVCDEVKGVYTRRKVVPPPEAVRQLHIALNVKMRRFGVTAPACDGPDCEICDLLNAPADRPPTEARVSFMVRCNDCGHRPCDCTEQPAPALPPPVEPPPQETTDDLSRVDPSESVDGSGL
jgi:hypothetical protein